MRTKKTAFEAEVFEAHHKGSHLYAPRYAVNRSNHIQYGYYTCGKLVVKQY